MKKFKKILAYLILSQIFPVSGILAAGPTNLLNGYLVGLVFTALVALIFWAIDQIS